MRVFRFRRPPRARPPFKPGLDTGDHYVMYVLPLLNDVEKVAGRGRIDALRLKGGRWQALLAVNRTWVYVDDMLRGDRLVPR